jgi:hypothetical protein
LLGNEWLSNRILFNFPFFYGTVNTTDIYKMPYFLFVLLFGVLFCFFYRVEDLLNTSSLQFLNFCLDYPDKVKVCFLTAGEMYDEEIRKESFPELDLNCFLRKPIANQDLIERVKDILNNNINP